MPAARSRTHWTCTSFRCRACLRLRSRSRRHRPNRRRSRFHPRRRRHRPRAHRCGWRHRRLPYRLLRRRDRPSRFHRLRRWPWLPRCLQCRECRLSCDRPRRRFRPLPFQGPPCRSSFRRRPPGPLILLCRRWNHPYRRSHRLFRCRCPPRRRNRSVRWWMRSHTTAPSTALPRPPRTTGTRGSHAGTVSADQSTLLRVISSQPPPQEVAQFGPCNRFAQKPQAAGPQQNSSALQTAPLHKPPSTALAGVPELHDREDQRNNAGPTRNHHRCFQTRINLSLQKTRVQRCHRDLSVSSDGPSPGA